MTTSTRTIPKTLRILAGGLLAVSLTAASMLASPQTAAADPPQTGPQLTAAVVDSLPIDVAFASISGSDDPLTEAQYTDYMTEMASWWVREARGLLGSADDQTATSYGAFTWTLYNQVKRIQSASPCSGNNSALFTDSAALWNRESGAYTKNADTYTHLLVVADENECSSGSVGLTYGVQYFDEAGFPGWGKVYSQVQGQQGYDRVASIGTLIHEIGHTFGLRHAVGGFTCSSGLDNTSYGFSNEVAECQRGIMMLADGYGDSTNVMGASAVWQNTGLNGYQKQVLGIIDDSSGLISVSTSGSQVHTITRSDTAQVSVDQAIRVVDDTETPLSEYAIDFPGSDACSVRVLRTAPTQVDYGTMWYAWRPVLATNMAQFGGSIPDTLKVNNPHTGSSEMCLTTGDSYTSWNGNVTITVAGIANDESDATIRIDHGTGSLFDSLSVEVYPSNAVPEHLVVGDWLYSGYSATPTPDSVAYQWLRDGQAIAGATLDYYEVQSADVGHSISLRVTVNKAGYLSSITTSTPSDTVTETAIFLDGYLPDNPSGGMAWLSIYVPMDVDWEIVSHPSWITVYGESSGTSHGCPVLDFALNVGPAREGFIVVEAGGIQQSVAVSQLADDCGLFGQGPACTWSNADDNVFGSTELPGDWDEWQFTAPASGTWKFTNMASMPDIIVYVDIYTADTVHMSGTYGNGIASVTVNLQQGQKYSIVAAATSESSPTHVYALQAELVQ